MVAFQAGGEGVQVGEVIGADPCEPVIELVAVALAHASLRRRMWPTVLSSAAQRAWMVLSRCCASASRRSGCRVIQPTTSRTVGADGTGWARGVGVGVVVRKGRR